MTGRSLQAAGAIEGEGTRGTRGRRGTREAAHEGTRERLAVAALIRRLSSRSHLGYGMAVGLQLTSLRAERDGCMTPRSFLSFCRRKNVST